VLQYLFFVLHLNVLMQLGCIYDFIGNYEPCVFEYDYENYIVMTYYICLINENVFERK
jgi:hypothetical protein